MKVCIILPKGLPVPATLGGAIESLMTDIADNNEKYKKLNLTIVSTYDEKAYTLSQGYKYSKFIYIDSHTSEYKSKAIKVRIANLFGKHKNTYNEMVLDRIKNNKYDYILVEDGAYHSFKSYLKYFNKDQMILHFHHNGVSDMHTDATYNRFIGVSKFVTDNFKNTSTIEKCDVLKNGVDIARFDKKISPKDKMNIRQSLGFKDDDFIVMFCGRLIPEKGVLELIQAINKIKNHKIKLMIVGSINFGKKKTSDYVKKIDKLVKESKGRIKTTGFINNSDLYKYYKSADLGVIPSMWEDAAPLVTIEIMSSGLPLIITKTGGAPEYVSEDTIIVPKDEKVSNHLKKAIEYLYENEDVRNKMKKSGIETSKNYTTERFYLDFVNLFLKK